MADIVSPVTVMFGSAKKKAPKKSAKDAPAPTMAGFPEYKPPSHEERLHNEAAHEHVRAAGDYVAGRISKEKYHTIKRRAESMMAKTPKNSK